MTILLIRVLNNLQMAVELSGPWNLMGIIGNRTCTLSIQDRLDPGTDEGTNASTVQSSDMNGVVYLIKLLVDYLFVHLRHPLLVFSESASLRTTTKCPEQSKELLGLIVNSLRAFDGAIPQGCPEARRMPQSAQKIAHTHRGENFQHTDGIVEGLEEDIEQTGGKGDDFTYVLALAETLALSGQSPVTDFAKMLYTILL